MADPLLASEPLILEKPDDRMTMDLPMHRPAPGMEMADMLSEEIAGGEDEESIFKDLLESPPTVQAGQQSPFPPIRELTVVSRAPVSADNESGRASTAADTPLEMFEFTPGDSGFSSPGKNREDPPQSAPKPAKSTKEDALEWVVEEP
ncbi:MAG: hypothetical protein HQL88_11195 [Magnetococcales bacterium]|nr:hypothetical protein [Magnetococcales bacterium]